MSPGGSGRERPPIVPGAGDGVDPAPSPPALRVLLVDDSGAGISLLASLLQDAPGIRIVGLARDGEDGLRQAVALRPDVVILDLQLPRVDGFAFLRLLLPRRPTPVVVVSAQTRRADVFRALELGALDFVARPAGEGASLELFRDELLRKCAAVRGLRLDNLAARRPPPLAAAPAPRVVAIGSSTGGPQAVHHLLAAVPVGTPLAFAIAQHMPERFTGTFAERLARATGLAAKEAEDGDRLTAGTVLVAPGGRHLELARREDGDLRARVLAADEGGGARYTPSVDRLFASVAQACGARACAVVLTGMGNDGSEGIQAVKRAGGLTLAESADTAVVYGMPQTAVETGAVDEVLALGDMPERLICFSRET